MYIKAIETKYKGYRFRSRSEARWAVFFDVARIKWEYELEGYDVNGKWYLPDFFLPDFHVFFEVKGTHEYDDNTIQLFSELIERKVLVAIGRPPEPDKWDCGESYGLQTLFPSDEWRDDLVWGYKDMFLECDNCGEIKIMNEMYSTMKEMCSCCSSSRLMPLSKALDAWRAARFEFGAQGIT